MTMKNILLITLLILTQILAKAQDNPQPKIGWFITPEVGTMFLEGHVGKTVGASFGVQLFKNHLKVGILNYGRSGPINGATFTTPAFNELVYKGKTNSRCVPIMAPSACWWHPLSTSKMSALTFQLW